MIRVTAEQQLVMVSPPQAAPPRSVWIVPSSRITSLATPADLEALPRVPPPTPQPARRAAWTVPLAIAIGGLVGACVGTGLGFAVTPPGVYVAEAFVRVSDRDFVAVARDLRAEAALVRSTPVVSQLMNDAKTRAVTTVRRLEVSASPLEDSGLLRVTAEHEQPAAAITIARRLALVLADRLDGAPAPQTTPVDPRHQLDSEIQIVRRQLERLPAPDHSLKPDLGSRQQQLLRLDAELDTLRRAERTLTVGTDARRSALMRATPLIQGDDDARLQLDPVIATATHELARAIREYNEQAARHRTDNHPDVQAIKNAIDQARASIARRRAEILENSTRADSAAIEWTRRQIELIDLEAELAATQVQRIGLQVQQETAREELEALRLRIARLEEQDRERVRLQGTLDDLVTQRRLLPADSQPIAQRSVSVIAGGPPTHARTTPIPWIPAAAGLVGGAILGGGGMILKRRRDDARPRRTDVERLVGAEVIAAIPDANRITHRSVMAGANSAADALGRLRSRLLTYQVPGRCSIVAVQAIAPRQGSSSVSIGLAILMGRGQRRTLLADLSALSPDLPARFAVDPVPGWTDLFRAPARLRTLIRRDVAESVDLLPLGSWVDRAPDLLGSVGMLRLLALARRTYDCIVLDLAPLSAMPDTDTLLPRLDAVVLVTHPFTSAARLHAAGLRLRDAGAPLLGVVLSGVR